MKKELDTEILVTFNRFTISVDKIVEIILELSKSSKSNKIIYPQEGELPIMYLAKVPQNEADRIITEMKEKYFTYLRISKLHKI